MVLAMNYKYKRFREYEANKTRRDYAHSQSRR